MPSGDTVRPGRWSDMKVLFDNGEYSVISGRYDGQLNLGERWNGEGGEAGFPSQGGNPLWHVVPGFLAIPILHGLLDELGRKPPSTDADYARALTDEIVKRNEVRQGKR